MLVIASHITGQTGWNKKTVPNFCSYSVKELNAKKDYSILQNDPPGHTGTVDVARGTPSLPKNEASPGRGRMAEEGKEDLWVRVREKTHFLCQHRLGN